MKKSCSKILACVLSFLMIMSCVPLMSAAAAESGESDFEYVTLMGNAVIVNYTGIADEVVIPDTLGGCPVTAVYAYAVSSNETIKSVYIPAGVTHILPGAFTGNFNMESVIVAEDNPNYCSVDGALFTKDMTEIMAYPIGSTADEYTVPEGVVSIGRNSFSTTLKMESITLPESLESIGISAFEGSVKLKEINIPSKIKRIEEHTFDSCSCLESINIPEGVEYIGDYAFANNNTFKSVNFPSTLKYIGDFTFSYDRALESVVLNEGLETIGEYAFYSCQGMTECVISDTVVTIGNSAFTDCSSIESVDVPASVESLGDFFFAGSKSLTDINVDENNNCYLDIDGVLYNKDVTKLLVYPAGREEIKYTIPDTVKEIDVRAFSYATALTEIDIPESVEVINDGAFLYCTSLESITFPEKVTEIYGNSLMGCMALETINIHDNIELIDAGAFMSTAFYNNEENWTEGNLYLENYLISASPEYSGTFSVKEGTTLIAGYAFDSCRNLEEVHLPDTVKYICKGAFFGCSSLDEITIPDSVERVDNLAFLMCSSLEDVTLSEKMDTITMMAFSRTGLREFTVPSNIKTIEASAFGFCTELESVVISEGVTKLCDGIFESCINLKSVTIPASVNEIDSIAFIDTPKDMVLYVTEDSYAEQFAKKYGYNYISSSADESTPDELGDVDRNGDVNIKDATAIQKHVAMLTILDDEAVLLADYDKETRITVKDATAIQKLVAGLI